MNTKLVEQVQQWLAWDSDPHTRQELQQLLDNSDEKALADRFAGRLSFGTAGLRGIVGAGPMRMNSLVVKQTTAGLGHYLLEQGEQVKTQGVILGYDGRHDSKRFAGDAAGVLLALGFKVYLTYQTAPTPLVAFGVPSLTAAAAIVITASHNPPAYNGYKVYWDNGAQIIAPHDTGIAAAINAIVSAKSPILQQSLAAGLKSKQLVLLDDAFYQQYTQALLHSAELNKQTQANKVSLAYSAMHGVGAALAENLLQQAGFEQVHSVATQRDPDGDFPTVAFPNPEEEGAMDRVIAEAKEYQTTLACANDPDADRFAVAVRRNDGEYQMLTGDQIGILLGHYLLSFAHPNNRLVLTTIVSSSLLAKIAPDLGGYCLQTLTGFKWLMNTAMQVATPEKQFLFAYEEALGYCVGNKVKDKDGLSALVAFAQLTAELASQGQTIWDRLAAIYQQYGVHHNQQVSIALTADSPNIGAYLRAHPPEKIADLSVLSIDDLSQARRFYQNGTAETLALPLSDVLIYQLEQGARVIVRPSGTEPKVKCYYEVVEAMAENESLQAAEARARDKMTQLIQAHQEALSEIQG